MNDMLYWSLKLILKLKIVHAKLWTHHNCTAICMGALLYHGDHGRYRAAGVVAMNLGHEAGVYYRGHRRYISVCIVQVLYTFTESIQAQNPCILCKTKRDILAIEHLLGCKCLPLVL